MIVLYIAIAILAFLIIICTIRAAAIKAAVPKETKEYPEADGKHIEHIAEAVKFRTLSNEDENKVDWKVFDAFRDFVKNTYPNVHSKCEILDAGYTRIYILRGTDKTKLPVAFLAHYDVVPAGADQAEKWTCEPFCGKVEDGYIWGRGSLDDKTDLIMKLETFEELLKEGYRGGRDLYLCMGHNEEISGVANPDSGANRAVAVLKKLGIRFFMVCDEGSAYMDGSIFGFKGSFVSPIGVVEKGKVDIHVTAKAKGGHSSTPPKKTALSAAAKAALKIDRRNMKARYSPALKMLFKEAGQYFKFPVRLVVCNMWLFGPLVKVAALQIPVAAAFFRTTKALTMAHGSEAYNILPQEAVMTFNFRIASFDSVEKVANHVKKAGGKKAEYIVGRHSEPSTTSKINDEAYNILKSTIIEMRPNTIVLPYINVGGTDSTAYHAVCDNVYRFAPLTYDKDNWESVHGANEKIKIDTLSLIPAFYKRLIEKLN